MLNEYIRQLYPSRFLRSAVHALILTILYSPVFIGFLMWERLHTGMPLTFWTVVSGLGPVLMPAVMLGWIFSEDNAKELNHPELGELSGENRFPGSLQ